MPNKILLTGLFFQAPDSLTSLNSQTRGPQLKVPPGGIFTQDFYVLKKTIDLSRAWTREPGISRRARYPEFKFYLSKWNSDTTFTFHTDILETNFAKFIYIFLPFVLLKCSIL